jgi:hypothetical protein
MSMSKPLSLCLTVITGTRGRPRFWRLEWPYFFAEDKSSCTDNPGIPPRGSPTRPSRSMRRLSFLLVCGGFLAGCGNFDACKNQCSSGLTHDSFCGCQDYSKHPPATGGPASGSGFDQAACVCQYSSGRVGAWFRYAPSTYGRVPTNISVVAPTCQDLTVCELTKTGDDSDQYTFFTGRMEMSVSSWQQITNFQTGGQSWTAYGQITQRKALLDHKSFTPRYFTSAQDVAMSFGIGLRHLQRLVQAKRDNSIQGCRATCSAHDSNYCHSQQVLGSDATGLRELRAFLQTKPDAIPASTLLAMFGIQSDPCKRGDTTLRDGIITNSTASEGSCTLISTVPEHHLSLTIDVPLFLEGSYVSDGQSFEATFSNPETRPRLHFVSLDDDPANVKNARYLDHDWGGDIKHVFSDPGIVGFSVGDSSCVQADMR